MGHRQEGAVRQFLDAMIVWSTTRPDVRAVALVGSWAREEAGPSSDVDVVVLTTDASIYLTSGDWAEGLAATALSTRRWGALTERRLLTATAVDVDFGVADPSWAATAPIDEGTARVVRDGLVALYDPDRLLERLKEAAQA